MKLNKTTQFLRTFINMRYKVHRGNYRCYRQKTLSAKKYPKDKIFEVQKISLDKLSKEQNFHDKISADEISRRKYNN